MKRRVFKRKFENILLCLIAILIVIASGESNNIKDYLVLGAILALLILAETKWGRFFYES